MEITIKATLAKKNLEMEKLEKSKKSHLRMISSSTSKLKYKYGANEDSLKVSEDINAKNIRMYDTHYPGFCYLRNGQYRKKTANNIATSNPDPVQCLEKLRAILFTDDELDIQKTMCLHLLGTHVQNKNHIQRKDGRLCSYVKAQIAGNNPHTLKALTQRTVNPNDSSCKYEKMLPRYILDVKDSQYGISVPLPKSYDGGSDEEIKKKRKLQVPIYINYETKMIVSSVLEALEAVDSPKFKALIELASSPEELRNMLGNENVIEFIIELAENPLILKPTSYDYVMTHLMFDKIPERGTLETVAQVLEVYKGTELKSCLSQIRRSILERHTELVNSNIIPRKKLGLQEKALLLESSSRISNSSISSNPKNVINTSAGIMKESSQDDITLRNNTNFEKVRSIVREKGNKTLFNKKRKNQDDVKSASMNVERISLENSEYAKNNLDHEEGLESKESFPFTRYRTEGGELNKWNLLCLSNSQRILLGLKIASLKCKPINMHQFEGKKKIDLAAIINPIIRPHVADVDYKQHSPENNISNFSLEERKVRKSSSKISQIQTDDLENLTRAFLVNLRLEISEKENKKRVNDFMKEIL